MEVFARWKRVTDPLNDNVKACLCGKQDFSSSESEHDGEEFDFLEDHHDADCSVLQNQILDDFYDSFREDKRCYSESESLMKESIKNLLNPMVNTHSLLSTHVSLAMETFDLFRSNKSGFQRKIVTLLRELGHNAGICKTRWGTNGVITSGSYEFIDVVHGQQRYFIDVDFSGEFEIARPTIEYESLLKLLPRVYVGRCEELKQIVKSMCEAAKRSLKSRDLHLPPWRKNHYMQLKWFGAYRRTVNPVPPNVSPEKFTVKCQSVGFDAVYNVNGRFIFPVATCTR